MRSVRAAPSPCRAVRNGRVAPEAPVDEDHTIGAGRRESMNARDQERLRRLCAEIVGVEPEDLEGDTDFVEDLNIDRDDLADLFVAVEDAFDISLEDGMRGIKTFEDLEAMVDDLIPA
jgi:acyl carrier protein